VDDQAHRAGDEVNQVVHLDQRRPRPTPEPEVTSEDRAAVYARARRIGGLPGAVLAGAMMGVKEVLQAPREEAPVVVATDGQPHDIDEDGLDFAVDDDGARAIAPALAPVTHLHRPPPRRRRRWR
jgi:hypothetical protein